MIYTRIVRWARVGFGKICSERWRGTEDQQKRRSLGDVRRCPSRRGPDQQMRRRAQGHGIGEQTIYNMAQAFGSGERQALYNPVTNPSIQYYIGTYKRLFEGSRDAGE
jgi:hypothetical protein